ncbi:MAG TPA: hypothetical protein VFW13_01340, partial [Phenylobacterium sp.]|nr:hypothetical protein [Phenylobacterium sp.]
MAISGVRRRITSAVLGAALLVAASPGVLRAGPYRAPRTAFGQPDLQGAWTNYSMTILERTPNTPLTFATRAEERAYEARMAREWSGDEADGLGQGVSEWHPKYSMARIDGRLRTSWIVSPADGRLPWRAEGRKRWEAITAAAKRDDATDPERRTASDRCLMGGLGSANPPMHNPPVSGGKLIVQTATEVAILSEMNHDVRIVRLGGRHLPKNVQVWMGDSIGRWEGDTLVVETTNFRAEEGWRNPFMISPDARVTERFTRVSPSELRYAF